MNGVRAVRTGLALTAREGTKSQSPMIDDFEFCQFCDFDKFL